MRGWAGLLVAAWMLGCPAPSTNSKSETSPENTSKPKVIFETSSARKAEVAVELARTEAEHSRGLMFREQLGKDEGMLFLFAEEGDHQFWMKNTLIPLDMIFIDGRGNVVGVVARAEPRTETPRGVGSPSRFVLEVAGGWADEHGVKAGDKATFRGLANR